MFCPTTKYPVMAPLREVIFLKNFITNPLIEVGDYTYYHDIKGPENFERENVVIIHNCKLIIGKFCQIAQGTKFIMSSANHPMNGFTTYPFFIFGDEWASYPVDLTNKGDTVIGHDVWFGHQAAVMPGIKIGHGAIIGAYSIVTKDVPPYTIVGGNPARPLRQRFSDDIINELLAIQWWDWPIDKIKQHLPFITGANIKALKQVN